MELFVALCYFFRLHFWLVGFLGAGAWKYHGSCHMWPRGCSPRVLASLWCFCLLSRPAWCTRCWLGIGFRKGRDSWRSACLRAPQRAGLSLSVGGGPVPPGDRALSVEGRGVARAHPALAGSPHSSTQRTSREQLGDASVCPLTHPDHSALLCTGHLAG